MAWTVARGAAIGFGMVLLTLIGGGIISFLNVDQLHNHDQLVAHTHQVLTELEGLMSSLKDAETGQRGYLITDDEGYLEPYHRSLGEIQARKQRLHQLMADNPSQLAKLKAAEEKIDERMKILEQNVAFHKTNGVEAARKE